MSFDYGQKSWSNEKDAAQYFCSELNIPLEVIDIKGVFLGDTSSLTDADKAIPTDRVDIESQQASEESAKSVWVSNRNGVFLNVAACWAEKLGASLIVPGFNAEEAATFPDNSVDYIEKMNACLKLSTRNGVQIHCFSQFMNKEQIMQDLVGWGCDLDHIWSCYYAGEALCGACESCQRFFRAKKSITHQKEDS